MKMKWNRFLKWLFAPLSTVLINCVRRPNFKQKFIEKWNWFVQSGNAQIKWRKQQKLKEEECALRAPANCSVRLGTHPFGACVHPSFISRRRLVLQHFCVRLCLPQQPLYSAWTALATASLAVAAKSIRRNEVGRTTVPRTILLLELCCCGFYWSFWRGIAAWSWADDNTTIINGDCPHTARLRRRSTRTRNELFRQ